MTSEIKVDTISENTSANGVTIDGLTIKDGNIIGDVALAGTTPTFTVGDGGAEDAALIFDGNAVDYYIALDDSADNLIIGSGSTVGSNSLITIDSDGDFTLDSAGDIILDADGAQVIFKDAGTTIGGFNNSSSDLNVFAHVQDKDIVFTGDDGGTTITALTLDMSDAGTAKFNHNIKLTTDDGFLSSGASDDFLFVHDGTDSKVFNSTGDLIIDNSASDKDIIFKGSDGGSAITALTLDMSAAGAATFNAGITAQAASTITTADNTAQLTLTSTDADANTGPLMVLNRDSGSPADNDACGNIQFKADDDGGNSTELASISATFTDVSNGAEDATFGISSVIGGSQMSRFKATASETVLNDDSGDIDFRVESNDLSHMLFLNAASNEIGLGSGNDYSARVLAHQSATDHHALNVEGQNSSYASTALNIGVTRNSSNAYNFIKCEARGFANKFIVRDDGLVSAITTTIASISDERIKQDITDANSQWDDIKALKFKNFRKKTAVRNEGDGALKELGVIAQDVEAAGMTGLIDYADPDTGHVKDDATFGTLYTQADEDAGNIPSGHFVNEVKEVKEQVKMVKYSIIWMKAMKALQEAQTRIETLETKVAALEG